MATVAQRIAARKTSPAPSLTVPAVPASFPILALNDVAGPSQPQQPTNLELWKMLRVIIDNQHAMGRAINKIHDRVHAIEFKADHEQKSPHGILWRIFENVCGIESMLLYIPED